MKDINANQHISKRFEEELADIQHRMLLMGGLIEEQLSNALLSLGTGDAELAESVVTEDLKVNAMEVSIDEECQRILAKRQPTASDLRQVMTVLKAIADLERIGDEAKRVGKMAMHVSELSRDKGKMFAIQHLGENVRLQLRGALDALARSDAEAALEVVKQDLVIDKEYEALMRQLITFMMEDSRSIPWVLDVIWSARSLERIGDRSRNICEHVIYNVKGKDVRHISLEKMEKTVTG